jgi:hypothetical protein
MDFQRRRVYSLRSAEYVRYRTEKPVLHSYHKGSYTFFRQVDNLRQVDNGRVKSGIF